MWSSIAPQGSDPLRQGDLIADVVFPRVGLPLATFEFEKRERALVNARTTHGIVVSQCCDNVGQSGQDIDSELISIAPVRRLGNLQPRHRVALQTYEPELDAATGRVGNNYSLDEFALQPIAGVLDDPGRGDLLVARLREVLPLEGDLTWLRAQRLATMEVEWRRHLRNNLSLLWGRAEEEDAAVLEQRGLPRGLPATAAETE